MGGNFTPGRIFDPENVSGTSKGGMGLPGKNQAAPQAPNFEQAAQQQSASSHSSVNGPFGSNAWTQNPDGTWSMSASLNPQMQSAANGLENSMQSGAQIDPSQARDQATNAAYTQATQQLDPQWAQAQEQQQTELENEGLDPSSDAWKNTFGGGSANPVGSFNLAKNNAYANAMENAQTGAGATAFSEGLAGNAAPYTELGQLNQVGQGLSGEALAGASPTQSLAAALQGYQGALQTYGIQQSGKNSTMGGLGQMGGTIGAAAMA